MTKETDKLEI